MNKKLIIAVPALFAMYFLYKKTQANNTGTVSSAPAINLIKSNSILESILGGADSVSGGGVKLRYFKSDEFGGWYEKMSPDLLLKLDEFRHQWGFPVEVSKHPDAVGREDSESASQHNILRWGEVRAVDVFPKNSVGGYINSAVERKRAYNIAKRVGFTGIGLYTDTIQGDMVHLDVRQAPLAKWSRVNGEYGAIEKVFV